MKTQSVSLFHLLKPVLAFTILVFSALGFSAYVSAAEQKPQKPVLEQVQTIVNINTADAVALTEVLTGIGAKKAQAIVEWRKQNGKFTNLEQLLEVKGIGEKTLAANRNRIKL